MRGAQKLSLFYVPHREINQYVHRNQIVTFDSTCAAVFVTPTSAELSALADLRKLALRRGTLRVAVARSFYLR